MPDLLLTGGPIHSLQSARPHAALLVRGGVIAAFDDEAVATAAHARHLDLDGRTVLPAFADSHLHLFSLIEQSSGVDCSTANTIAGLVALLAGAVGTGWVRASGYDHLALAEQRHVTKRDLDHATRRPVRLMHRTGHLAVLNSAALDLIPDSLLDRGLALGFVELAADGSGPSGVMWEPGQWLSRNLVPPLGDAEIAHGLRTAQRRLFASGITAVHDASVRNDAQQWLRYLHLAESGQLRLRTMVMLGWQPDLPLPALAGEVAGPPRLVLGPLKIMLSDDESGQLPQPQLVDMIRQAGANGQGVALHAVVESATRLAVAAAVVTAGARPQLRIEHAAEWPEELFAKAGSADFRVTLHPGWLWERGDRYLAQTSANRLDGLHRGRSFATHGIPIAFGSDAPAGQPEPATWLASACTRRSKTGALVNPHEALDRLAALRAACSGRAPWDRTTPDGRLAAGSPADFVIADRDPMTCDAGDLAGLTILATYLDGEPVFGADTIP